ncbi:MAG TPA: RusA family crossover junction endodeoxyribonuclease [Bacteroidales bacterium]|nr:RusA family crossover junction endodeoxyribonuclease [Bacteroidales bacterium]
MFECTIPLSAVAKGRARVFRTKTGVRAFTPKKTANFEFMVRFFLSQKADYELLDNPIDVPVRLVCDFQLTRPKKPRHPYPAVRPDLDNYIKAILDAMNGIILKDDALVCQIVAKKSYAIKTPQIWIKLEAL